MLFLGTHMLIDEISNYYYNPTTPTKSTNFFLVQHSASGADVARLHGMPRTTRDEIEPAKKKKKRDEIETKR